MNDRLSDSPVSLKDDLGEAGAPERIIEDEKLAIGEIIYLCTECRETGVDWEYLDDSTKQHYAMIVERINALVCKLVSTSEQKCICLPEQ